MRKSLNLLAQNKDPFLVCSERRCEECHLMLSDNFVGTNDNLLHPKQAELRFLFFYPENDHIDVIVA